MRLQRFIVVPCAWLLRGIFDDDLPILGIRCVCVCVLLNETWDERNQIGSTTKFMICVTKKVERVSKLSRVLRKSRQWKHVRCIKNANVKTLYSSDFENWSVKYWFYLTLPERNGTGDCVYHWCAFFLNRVPLGEGWLGQVPQWAIQCINIMWY